MKFTLLFFLLLSLGTTLYAQNISNKESSKHQVIEGTNLKMIPPANFSKGENFYGFQQLQTNSTIIAFEVKRAFEKQTAGFTNAHLSQSGFKVKEVKRFKLNADSAVYVSAMQEWEGDVFYKEIMAIGNEYRTVVINAACLEQHPEMVSQLKAALFTAFIDDGEIKSAKDIVDFTLDESGTDLRFYDPASKGLNALVYFNTDLLGKPFLIATKSLIAIQQNHQQFAIESIKDLGVIIPEKTIQFNETSLAGLPGYESIIEGKDKNGTKAYLYRVIVFTADNYYYSFAGRIMGDETADNIKRFKALINTFNKVIVIND